jgi:hypothetical protein
MLRFLGISFLVLVGCAVMFVIWASQQDRSARRYVSSAVPAIFNEWDVEALNQRASDDLKKEPQYHSAVPRMFLGLKHTLGPLKSAEEPQGSAGYNWGSDAPVQGAYGDYLIRVRFERGEAEVRLIVVRERGAWKVRGFNVGAPVPLRPRNDVQTTAA